jgi:hypothetical protein
MHLSANALTLIGIPLAAISAVILGFGAAIAALRRLAISSHHSKWRKSNGVAKRDPLIVPRDEFTELASGTAVGISR